MFDKIRKSTIEKLSDGIKQKTEEIAGTLTETIADISESVQEKTDDISQTVGEWFDSDDSENKISYKIDEATGEERVVVSLTDDAKEKGAWETLVEEIKTRNQENNDFRSQIDSEKIRLKNERIAAKNRNVFRKIKPVDSYISKKEEARDAQALLEFKKSKQEELSAARSQRGKEIAKKNRKTIAGLIAGVLVAGSVAGGISNHSRNVALATSYDTAVKYIISEEYDAAKNELSKLSYKDSFALLSYSNVQLNIDNYKGKPDDMNASLEAIEDIVNEEVNKQRDVAYEEIKSASVVQNKINSLEITTLDSLPNDEVKIIKKDTEKIADRYRVLIDTKQYDIVNDTIYAIENKTEAGVLISELEGLDDITLDSETKLTELRSKYDSLSEKDRSIVFNYSALTSAENKYKELKTAHEEKIAEEEAKKKAEEEKKKQEEEERKREEEERAKEEKKAVLQAEAEEYAEDAVNSATVWTTGTGKYHVDGCSYVKRHGETTYGYAKYNYDPCGHCHPDVWCEKSRQIYIDEYIRNHSDD